MHVCPRARAGHFQGAARPAEEEFNDSPVRAQHIAVPGPAHLTQPVAQQPARVVSLPCVGAVSMAQAMGLGMRLRVCCIH